MTRLLLVAGLCGLCACGNSTPPLPPLGACIQGVDTPTVLPRAPAGSLPCDLLPPR
jgi:hypothetical protein